MRPIRILLGAVGLLALLGPASACERPRAAASVWIEVTPATVDAGSFVRLRAKCGDNGDNNVPATVTSVAFGTVTVQPLGNMLTAEAGVSPRTRMGTYDVNLVCQNGSAARTSLQVGSAGPTAEPSGQPSAEPSGQPSAESGMGPHTGGGFLAHRGRRGLPVPAIWLIGGAGALVAAGALGAITGRRRRGRPAH